MPSVIPSSVNDVGINADTTAMLDVLTAIAEALTAMLDVLAAMFVELTVIAEELAATDV